MSLRATTLCAQNPVATRRAGYGVVRLVLAASVLSLALGGCASQRNYTAKIDAEVPDSYAERHPVALGDVPKSVDIFLAPNAGLDHRQREDVREFVKTYRKEGKGALVAYLPGRAPHGAVQHTLNEIRKVAGVPIVIGQGPTHASAASVRLSYSALGSRLVSKCGQWPYDPAGGATLQAATNRPYYNHGCAYQSMMAAQVANPIDTVRARQEGPADIQRRLNVIEKVRDGESPATEWPTETTKINQALQ